MTRTQRWINRVRIVAIEVVIVVVIIVHVVVVVIGVAVVGGKIARIRSWKRDRIGIPAAVGIVIIVVTKV